MASRLWFFETSSEEAKDPQLWVGITRKFPDVRKSDNAFLDQERVLARNAMLRAVNMMWRQPQICIGAAAWCDGRVACGDLAVASRASASAGKTLRSLEVKFSAGFILEQAPWIKEDELDRA